MNKIICPNCDHKYDADDMYKSDNDLFDICPHEETVQEFCTNCGEEFAIKGGYNPTYEIGIDEDDFN